MDEVAGSIPVSSTSVLSQIYVLSASALAGFVAGEGWFSISRRRERFTRDGSERLRFLFGVTVATRDRPLLEALQQLLGAGTIAEKPPSKPGHLPKCEFSIRSSSTHRSVTIPFAERFLLPSHKREQFEHWRNELYRYEHERPSQYGRGPSPCSIAGCDKPVRGRRLCRSHYYRATGY
jgi:LAGLIDADG endonuclease